MTTATLDEALVARIRASVAAQVSDRAAAGLVEGRRLDTADQAALARSLVDDELERHASACLAAGQPVLNDEEERAVGRAVLDRIFELARLQPLLDDDRIVNIHANGCDVVFIEYADGTKAPGPPLAASDDELIELIRQVGRRYGLSEREFNPAHPQLNLQLPDGARLFGLAWVCARPVLAVRRHRHLRVELSDLEALGTVERPVRSLLAACVRSRQQIIVDGATGVGKTTMLRALGAAIPPAERIVTIETELELGLDRFPDLHPDCVALETREPNVEGVGAVTAAELVRMSLRMSPDRVLLGEVRGDECTPLLNVMSQGNEGSMCTIHADSSAGVFRKLALYAIQSPERLPLEATMLLASAAIDVIVHMDRTPAGRRVTSIRHVAGFDGAQVLTNELYRRGSDDRPGERLPIPADLLGQLVPAGFDADAWNGGW